MRNKSEKELQLEMGQSCLGWLIKNGIKNERGQLMEFDDHMFLLEPFANWFPKQVCMKSAQVGWSTLSILKSLYAARSRGMNCIYTLPTFDDIRDFVPAKVDGIIKNNPKLAELMDGSDAITKKKVGDNFIWYRGTYSKKAAIMHSSDLNIYDELDASNLSVIDMYASRLQKSWYRGEWKFSNPIRPGGIDKSYKMSDMRKWFIQCSKCNEYQTLEFHKNVDKVRKTYICAHCKRVLSENDRHDGEWVAMYPSRSDELQGYHVNQLMAMWVTAKELCYLEKTKGAEYFHNMVLGLPYIDETEAVSRELITGIVQRKSNSRLGNAMGVDVQYKVKHYVIGNHDGIFEVGRAEGKDGWKKIEKLMLKYGCTMVVDGNPDFYPRRELVPKYPGRVFAAFYRKDKFKKQTYWWGQKNNKGYVFIDRNQMIQQVINEMIDREIVICSEHRDPESYVKTKLGEYIDHWENIYKVTEPDHDGFEVSSWAKKGPDDFVHATAYWRVALSKVPRSKSRSPHGILDVSRDILLAHEVFNDTIPSGPFPIFEAENVIGQDEWLYH